MARAAFGALVIRARSSYKNEIAALYPPLALAPLESRESSPAAKLTALRLIRALCGDPQVLVDIFVNYDCDADAPNLYERTVAALAGATVAAGSGDAQQVRNGAVQCVLAVVRSLRTWRASSSGDDSGDDSGEDSDSHEHRAGDDDEPSEDVARGRRFSGGRRRGVAARTPNNARVRVRSFRRGQGGEGVRGGCHLAIQP